MRLCWFFKLTLGKRRCNNGVKFKMKLRSGCSSRLLEPLKYLRSAFKTYTNSMSRYLFSSVVNCSQGVTQKNTKACSGSVDVLEGKMHPSSLPLPIWILYMKIPTHEGVKARIKRAASQNENFQLLRE